MTATTSLVTMGFDTTAKQPVAIDPHDMTRGSYYLGNNGTGEPAQQENVAIRVMASTASSSWTRTCSCLTTRRTGAGGSLSRRIFADRGG